MKKRVIAMILAVCMMANMGYGKAYAEETDTGMAEDGAVEKVSEETLEEEPLEEEPEPKSVKDDADDNKAEEDVLPELGEVEPAGNTTSAESGTVLSGNFGEDTNATWTLDTNTGVMRLEGEGEVNFYDREGDRFSVAQVAEICIGSGITGIWGCFSSSWCNVVSLIADSQNPYYSSSDGVLFNKNGTILLHFPVGKTGSYNIPNYVTRIEKQAFYDSNLSSVTIPGSVKEIGEKAFYASNNITDISMAEGVEKIEDRAFSCYRLKSIKIPSTVTDIGEYVFWACGNLVEVTTAADIGDYEFSQCKNLKSVVMEEGVTKIGSSAFENCENLKEIHFSKSVKEVDGVSFYRCDNLEKFTVDSGNPNLCAIDGVLFSKDKTELIAYPAGKKNASYDIPKGVTIIGNHAFQSCDALENITIPKGVTKICWGAFSGCAFLKNVVVPEGVTEFGGYAFRYCSALEYIVIPKTVVTWPATTKGDDDRAIDYEREDLKIYGYSEGRYSSRTNYVNIDNGINLTLNANGGIVSTTKKTVYPASTYGTLPTPIRSGYTFNGWYTSANGGTRIEADEVVRTVEDQTFYAHWRLEKPTTPSQNKIKVDKNKHTITLSWGTVKNAEKIEILRSVNNGSYQVWKTVSADKTSLSFSEKDYAGTGKKYSFKLRTYKTADGQKLYSGYSTAYSITYGKFSAPKAAIKVTGANTVKVSWKKVYGAKGYVVYRATSKNGTYKRYKTVKNNVSSLKDTKLKSGKTYYYKVAAYTTADKKNIYGNKSSAVKRKIIGKLKNPVQKVISLNKNKKTFTISWKQVKNADKIVILKKVDNGKFKEWKTVSAKKGKATYSYTNLADGHSYTFRLKAYYKTDGTKIESGTSKGYTINK